MTARPRRPCQIRARCRRAAWHRHCSAAMRRHGHHVAPARGDLSICGRFHGKAPPAVITEPFATHTAEPAPLPRAEVHATRALALSTATEQCRSGQRRQTGIADRATAAEAPLDSPPAPSILVLRIEQNRNSDKIGTVPLYAARLEHLTHAATITVRCACGHVGELDVAVFRAKSPSHFLVTDPFRKMRSDRCKQPGEVLIDARRALGYDRLAKTVEIRQRSEGFHRIRLLNRRRRPHMRVPGTAERGDDHRCRASSGVPCDVVDIPDILLRQANTRRARIRRRSLRKLPRRNEQANPSADDWQEALQLRRNPDNAIDII